MIDWVKQDREQREALERVASCGERLNVAGHLNKMVKDHANRELPGMLSYAMIRLMQSNGAREAKEAKEARAHNAAHDAFEKAVGLENFNRLHPESARGRPMQRSTPIPVQSGGASFSEPRLNPVRETRPRSSFDLGRDPGNARTSRFEPGGKYDPPRK